jgi:transmembrane sensor
MNEAGRIDAAADWLLRLQSETASDEIIRKWVQWCEADARNQQAFDRVRELLQVADGLAGEVQDGELIGATAGASSRAAQTFESSWRARLQRPLRALAAALAILAIATVVWVMLIGTGHLPVPNGSVIASSAPVRTAMLPDGSRVALASKSTVAVSYTNDTRALELRDGEAFFSVTPNKQRPFIVTAGGVSVRAVGTAFNVRRAAQRVVVTVTEGTVDVYRQGQGAAPVRAGAGFQVAWQVGTGQQADAATSDEPVMTSVKPAVAMGWRDGRLEYRDEPLDAVVADINRYATRPVVIADESARKLRFSGTVMVELTDEWLSALPSQFPVTLQRENGVDLIHSAVSSPAH